MMIGYARVSTKDQSTDLQREQLMRAGCERVFEDKASGKDVDREQLIALIDFVREGDVVVVCKVDRLVRNAKEFWPLVERIERKGVKLKSLDGSLDTTTPMGVAVTGIAAVFAGLERDLIAARRTEGIERAKQNGIRFGRRPKLGGAQVEDVISRIADGQTISSVARLYNVGRATIQRIIHAHLPEYVRQRDSYLDTAHPIIDDGLDTPAQPLEPVDEGEDMQTADEINIDDEEQSDEAEENL